MEPVRMAGAKTKDDSLYTKELIGELYTLLQQTSQQKNDRLCSSLLRWFSPRFIHKYTCQRCIMQVTRISWTKRRANVKELWQWNVFMHAACFN